MAHFILSAFADEAACSLDSQIAALKQEQIPMIELRGVDGRSCADLTTDDAVRISRKLSAHGITLSAMGSPYGKIGILDDMTPHLQQFTASLEVCRILGCNRIRMFSFYLPHELPEGASLRAPSDISCTDTSDIPSFYRDEVLRRLEQMVTLARKSGILLVHENEKGIYGDVPERCIDLYDYFHGDLGIAFDPANYVQCGVDPWKAYQQQKDTITYFHMKDALAADGSVVCVGNGDGSVPRILADAASRTDDVILTVEPHLHIFSGSNQLQEKELLHHDSYPDSTSAFHAACAAVKKILPNQEVQ